MPLGFWAAAILINMIPASTVRNGSIPCIFILAIMGVLFGFQ